MKNQGNPMKAALHKLLSHGEDAKDQGLMRMAAAKKGAHAAPEVCPECAASRWWTASAPPGGYEKPALESGDGDLASLLESGAKE